MDFAEKQKLHQIFLAKDRRYDGRIYCGVKTTGIYCRPICPARARVENCSFFKSQAEAELAGFRACLRCRPDLAPNSAQFSGTGAIVNRALTMISRGDVDHISLETFSNQLGVTDRHLRRLFEEHVGASPIEVATSKRLHLARQLLNQSNLSIAEIAFASGFGSLRRFNEAFKDRFKSTPTSMRKGGASKNKQQGLIEITLPVIEPFDWDSLTNFFSNHLVAGVESVKDGKYRRAIQVGDQPGAIEVGYNPVKSEIHAQIFLEQPLFLRATIEKLKDLLDLRANPHAHKDSILGPDTVSDCYRRNLGIRIPGAWDPFAAAVTTIVGQLISVAQARQKTKRLVELYGERIAEPIFEECSHLFPRPDTLIDADFTRIGLTRVRGETIRELSRHVLNGSLNLSRTADIEKTKRQLMQIKGIGHWTAEMIAMQCLGDTNAFPKTDLILKRALEHHNLTKGDWSPWNAYVALALWKTYAQSLSKARTKTLLKA